MSVFSVFITSFAFSSLAIAISQPSFSANTIAQLDNLENLGEVTTSILDKLGYDCDTVAGVGLVCKKCSSNNSFTEKCTTYICDAVTKKCRKKNLTLPNIQDSSRE
jgi:hypothetical protein